MAALFLHPHLADPDSDFFFTRDVVDDAEFRHDHHGAKRRRIENLSRRYLQGHPVSIQTARLRGPFGHGKPTTLEERAPGQSCDVTQRRVPQRQKVEKSLRKRRLDHISASSSRRQVTPEVPTAATANEATHDWLRRLQPRAESPETEGGISRLEHRLEGLESHTPSKPSHPRSIEKNPTTSHVLGSKDLRLCWNLKEKKKDTRGIASDSLLELYAYGGLSKARSNSQPTLTDVPLSLQANVDEDSVRQAPHVEDDNDQTESDVTMWDRRSAPPSPGSPPNTKESHGASLAKPKSERAPLTSRSATFAIPPSACKARVIKIAQGQENAPHNVEILKEPPARPRGVRRLSELGQQNAKKRTHDLHASPSVFRSPFIFRKASDEGKPKPRSAKREKRKVAIVRSVHFGSSPVQENDRLQSDGGAHIPDKPEPNAGEIINTEPEATPSEYKSLFQENIPNGNQDTGVAYRSLFQDNIHIEPKANYVAHENPTQEHLPDGSKASKEAHGDLIHESIPIEPEPNEVAQKAPTWEKRVPDALKGNEVADETQFKKISRDRPDINHVVPKNSSQENLVGGLEAKKVVHEALHKDSLPNGRNTNDTAHGAPLQETPDELDATEVANQTVTRRNLHEGPIANNAAHEASSSYGIRDKHDANHVTHQSLFQELDATDPAQESQPQDFSTQAALVSAQRAFQQQLISPAKKSDIYNLMDPISDSQNTTPPPASPMPTFSPITPFRMVNREPESTDRPPTSAAPPVSTQELFNAASPFAFSTVKKPKSRKRVSIGIHSLLNPQRGSSEKATPNVNHSPAIANADGDTTVADPIMFAPTDVEMMDTGTPFPCALRHRPTPLWTPINKPGSQPSPSKSASASPLLYHHHTHPSTAPPSSSAPQTLYHLSQAATQASYMSVSASSPPRIRRQQRQRQRRPATDRNNSGSIDSIGATKSAPSSQSEVPGLMAHLSDAQEVPGVLLGDDEEVDVDAVVEAADSFLSTWDWRRDLASVGAV